MASHSLVICSTAESFHIPEVGKTYDQDGHATYTRSDGLAIRISHFTAKQILTIKSFSGIERYLFICQPNDDMKEIHLSWAKIVQTRRNTRTECRVVAGLMALTQVEDTSCDLTCQIYGWKKLTASATAPVEEALLDMYEDVDWNILSWFRHRAALLFNVRQPEVGQSIPVSNETDMTELMPRRPEKTADPALQPRKTVVLQALGRST